MSRVDTSTATSAAFVEIDSWTARLIEIVLREDGDIEPTEYLRYDGEQYYLINSPRKLQFIENMLRSHFEKTKEAVTIHGRSGSIDRQYEALLRITKLAGDSEDPANKSIVIDWGKAAKYERKKQI